MQGYLACWLNEDGTLYHHKSTSQFVVGEEVSSSIYHLIVPAQEDAESLAWYAYDMLDVCIVPVEVDEDGPDTMTVSASEQIWTPQQNFCWEQEYVRRNYYTDTCFARTFRIIGPAIPRHEFKMMNDIPLYLSRNAAS